ncbi:MAG: sugar transferase, partial [Chloroflexota bacterium]
VVTSSLAIYNPQFTYPHPQYKRIQPMFLAITGASFVFAGLAYIFYKELSRILFFYFYVLDIIFLIGWRQIASWVIKEEHLSLLQPTHRVLIFGEGELADNVATAIQTFAWSGLEFVGFVNHLDQAVCKPQMVDQFITDHKINEVIFALPPGQRDLLQQMVVRLQPLPVNLRLVPDVLDLVFIRATIEDFAGLPLIGLREPAINIVDRLIKRIFDIIVASLLLIIIAPLLLISALLVWQDSKGDIFYRAQRVGEGGKIFTMIKFRTMVEGADKQEKDILLPYPGQIGVNKTPTDQRVTRLGRFLRRTSLDELPQLLNVLKGDMSLVGPRPEMPWLVEQYEPWQHQRFLVPQGMTGWWQIKNRGQQQAYHLRIEDDLYYIHNYSFFLDLRILWMTVGAIVRGDGAY